MINLPKLNWFLQEQGGYYITNVYSGSLGTDPTKGFTNKRSFNYKVAIKLNEDKKTVAVCAEYYYMGGWRDGSHKSESISREFEASQEGISNAEKWICEEYEKG